MGMIKVGTRARNPRSVNGCRDGNGNSNGNGNPNKKGNGSEWQWQWEIAWTGKLKR